MGTDQQTGIGGAPGTAADLQPGLRVRLRMNAKRHRLLEATLREKRPNGQWLIERATSNPGTWGTWSGDPLKILVWPGEIEQVL